MSNIIKEVEMKIIRNYLLSVLMPLLLINLYVCIKPAYFLPECSLTENSCFICLWNDVPTWVKILLLLALVGLAVLGGWYAGVIAAGYWGWGLAGAYLAGSVAASFSGYESMSKFFGYDNLIWDTEYGSGLDTIEDAINIISPVPNSIGDATGANLPGSNANNGLADQAVEAGQGRKKRIEDMYRDAAEDR
jgi:hypothetical protein